MGALIANLGNIYHIDSEGVINNNKPLFVKRILIYEVDTAAASFILSINGSTAIQHIGGLHPHANLQSIDVGGVWMEHLSAKTVTACTGWLFLG